MNCIKIIVVIFLSTLFTSVLAQNKIWAESGAHWSFEYLHYTAGPSALELSLTGNTTIQGYQCDQFSTIWHRFEWDYQNRIPKYIETQPHLFHITYTSGDTVFFYHDNQFFVLYDFGANIGDSWDLGLDSNQYGDSCSKSIVVVADTGSEVVGGQKLRYLDLEMSNDKHSYNLAGRAYEKIGRLPYPFPVETDECAPIIAHPMQHIFRCYGDDFFPTYHQEANTTGSLWLNECDVNFTVGINQRSNNQSVKIYPNPNQGRFTVSLSNEEEGLLKILSPTGSLMYEKTVENITSLEIELPANISPGVYLLTFQGTTNSFHSRIVLQ